MGDPFSVAGTAVGITSLGIQTCQILQRYYSQFKDFPEHIRGVLRQVEGLESILHSLQEVKEKIEIDNHAPSSQLHLALQACGEVLDDLKRMADKCSTEDQPKTIKARAKNVRQRVVWPFRKDELTDLQNTLSRFQDNLMLALQIAGFDGILRNVHSLHPTLEIVRSQTTNIEQRLTCNGYTLELIREDVIGSSRTHSQEHADVRTELSELRDELSRYSATMQSLLKPLVNYVRIPPGSIIVTDHISQIRNNATLHDFTRVPPSLLAEATEVVQDVAPKVRTALRQYDQSARQTTMTSDSYGWSTQCHCRSRTKRSTKRTRWLWTLSEEMSSHQPSCPHFAHGDYSRSVAAQFTIYSRLIGVCVQAGWQSSRRGGWNSIAPVLRYRTVVSSEYPVFAYLTGIRRSLSSPIYSDISNEALTSILTTSTRELQQMFGTGGINPTVLDSDGNGILFVSFSVQFWVLSLTMAVCALIDSASPPALQLY
jgi:hypothetical protein